MAGAMLSRRQHGHGGRGLTRRALRIGDGEHTVHADGIGPGGRLRDRERIAVRIRRSVVDRRALVPPARPARSCCARSRSARRCGGNSPHMPVRRR